MNCKPGDIATITHPDMCGHLVSVLYAAPVGVSYWLPDGHLALSESRSGAWVCESLGSKFPALVKNSDGSISPRLAQYASISDVWLRPIRDPGDDATDESAAYLPPVPTTKRTPETAT